MLKLKFLKDGPILSLACEENVKDILGFILQLHGYFICIILYFYL